MPPSNQRRREQLADAAIEIVVRDGLHGLSHRAVDEHADVPRGTASNYFRSRDALVEGATRRVVELHFAMIQERRSHYSGRLTRVGLTEFLQGVVDQAITRYPQRYLAMLELTLECTRKPELRKAFAGIADEAMNLTQEVHRGDGFEPSEEDVELLNVFYNGVLFTALAMPQTLGSRTPGELTRDLLIKLLPPQEAKENGS